MGCSCGTQTSGGTADTKTDVQVQQPQAQEGIIQNQPTSIQKRQPSEDASKQGQPDVSPSDIQLEVLSSNSGPIAPPRNSKQKKTEEGIRKSHPQRNGQTPTVAEEGKSATSKRSVSPEKQGRNEEHYYTETDKKNVVSPSSSSSSSSVTNNSQPEEKLGKENQQVTKTGSEKQLVSLGHKDGGGSETFQDTVNIRTEQKQPDQKKEEPPAKDEQAPEQRNDETQKRKSEHDYQLQFKKLEDEHERLNKETERVQKEKEVLEKENQSLRDSYIKHKEGEKKLQEQYKIKEDEALQWKTEGESLKKEAANTKYQLEEAQKELQKEMHQKAGALQAKEMELSKLRSEKSKLEKEKDELLIRLSAMAGRKLTDNNPNIADLSDLNRPTKLAEKYSELYDNAWTDAFTSLQEFGELQDEEKAVTLLLNILMIAYDVSLNTAKEQLRILKTNLQQFHGTADEKSVRDVMKQLKDSRKKITKPSEDLKMAFLNQLNEQEKEHAEKFIGVKTVKTYLEECLQLCWLMVIQDPPLYLHIEGCKKGDTFDKNSFREYTKGGYKVAFAVWPALMLEKGGALLSKGVVQCMEKHLISSLREEPSRLHNEDSPLSRSLNMKTVSKQFTTAKDTGLISPHITRTDTISEASPRLNNSKSDISVSQTDATSDKISDHATAEASIHTTVASQDNASTGKAPERNTNKPHDTVGNVPAEGDNGLRSARKSLHSSDNTLEPISDSSQLNSPSAQDAQNTGTVQGLNTGHGSQIQTHESQDTNSAEQYDTSESRNRKTGSDSNQSKERALVATSSGTEDVVASKTSKTQPDLVKQKSENRAATQHSGKAKGHPGPSSQKHGHQQKLSLTVHLTNSKTNV